MEDILKTIKIEQEFRVPGTDIIVERGDVLSISDLNEAFIDDLKKVCGEIVKNIDGVNRFIVSDKNRETISLYTKKGELYVSEPYADDNASKGKKFAFVKAGKDDDKEQYFTTWKEFEDLYKKLK